MDFTLIARSLFTVFCFATFLVILIGAYSKKSKDRYQEAANLPFLDDEENSHSISTQATSKGVQ